MRDLVSAYSELVALTQIYLLQEHTPKEWIFCDPETYQFFKARAQSNKAPAEKAKAAATSAEKKIEKIVPVEPPAKEMAEQQSASKPIPPEVKQVAEALPPQKAKPPLFTPEPLGAAKGSDLSDMQKKIAQSLPHVKIIETPPKVQSKGVPQPRVVVLALGETGEELLFVHNVASAIDRLLMPAEVLSLNKGGGIRSVASPSQPRRLKLGDSILESLPTPCPA